jgi:hypothetical protein
VIVDSIRVYLNDQAVDLPVGATVRDAIHRHLPELLPDSEAGRANLTDGRGLPVALDGRLTGGSILRAARSSRRTAPSDAGA